MQGKLSFLYLNHFKAVIALNVFVSLFFSYLFFIKGFDKLNLYFYSVIFKLMGYILSVMIEKIIFPERQYFFRNLRFSYRKIFSVLFITDFLIFMLFLFLTYQFP